MKEGQKKGLLDQVLRALRTAHHAVGHPEQLFIQLEIQRVDQFVVSVQIAAHLVPACVFYIIAHFAKTGKMK